MPDIELGAGEKQVKLDVIDTSGVSLDMDEPAQVAAPRALSAAQMSEKEAINQAIIQALRENLENPVFPILIVRMFDLGGALTELTVQEMPPLQRLAIGAGMLIVVIGLTNPQVVTKIADRWKEVRAKRNAGASLEEDRALPPPREEPLEE